MNFVSYTDWSVRTAVDLVNSLDTVTGADSLGSTADLRRFLSVHEMEIPRAISTRDLREVGKVRARLRAIFETESERPRATLLNELLAGAGTLPQVTDHDGAWHFHHVPSNVPVAQRMAATAGMALAMVVTEYGHDRLGICAADRCEDVYIDTSRNRSRRYCDEACASRMNVAAFRARRRARASAAPSGFEPQT